MPIRDIQALETTEKIMAALALRRDRDAAIDRLIASIARDRAELIASLTAGPPARPGRGPG